ncbi:MULTISPECIES: ATP-binding protein [Kitasatospora]|uniref:ATP-binding protein n=1 Tax=Kitasatospora TaxID=2063 RepID=UPI000CB3DE30|nr:ATP-binding protein [Kitasatospora sp. GP30]MDH6144089.1 anti-sigma regulatory factor (Ser/Thr protein kinase) [Kitasatospora sp. GP30]
MSLVPLLTYAVDGPSDPDDEDTLTALVVRATVGTARHRLRDHLTAHGLDPDDACLVLSELLGNALLHGGETAAVAWRLSGDRLRIGVADTAALSLPVIQDACTREGGRGLLLVEQLAHSWGVRPLGALGKEVWCNLEVKAA